MNNKQLFKQSAGKILSRNQLEGVMRLHNALFEGVNAEQVADTVADAVKDAVEDSLDSVADQQVADDVSEVSSITFSPEDQIRLESLLGSMSDDERVAFFESLDEQQAQILTEGLGSVVKTFFNFFTKEGRKANRFNKYSKLAKKDAAMTSQLDKFRHQNNISSKTANKLDKLMTKRDKTRQKMNDIKYKASKDPAEYQRLEQEGLKNGSRNLSQETMDAEKARLVTERDNALNTIEQKYRPQLDALERQKAQRLQELNDSENALKDLLEKDRKAPGTVPQLQIDEAKRRVATARGNVNRNRKAYNDKQANYNAEREAINQSFEPHINDMDNRINMSRQDAGNFTYGTNSARFNNANVGGAAAGANGANRGMNGQFSNPFANPYTNPYMNPYMNPEMWKKFTRRFSTMGEIRTALIGSWKAFKAALGLGAIGALGYGGYKVYDFFANPQEIDLNIGDGDGRIPKNVKTVIGLLAGGIGGRVIAKFIGFDSTTGKNVGSLLGAVLVAYFMFLNNGDEENAKEMLDEYNNASSTEQEAIEEALNFNGLGAALKEIYLENSSL